MIVSLKERWHSLHYCRQVKVYPNSRKRPSRSLLGMFVIPINSCHFLPDTVIQNETKETNPRCFDDASPRFLKNGHLPLPTGVSSLEFQQFPEVSLPPPSSPIEIFRRSDNNSRSGYDTICLVSFFSFWPIFLNFNRRHRLSFALVSYHPNVIPLSDHFHHSLLLSLSFLSVSLIQFIDYNQLSATDKKTREGEATTHVEERRMCLCLARNLRGCCR